MTPDNELNAIFYCQYKMPLEKKEKKLLHILTLNYQRVAAKVDNVKCTLLFNY